MWCVRTASRLHLGLLSLPADGERWPDRHGLSVIPARRYGGVGLMIDTPGIVLRVDPAKEWSAEGPLADRALAFARRMVTSLGKVDIPPRRILLEAAPREHVGLGTGTQLGLAVARALAASWDVEMPIHQLAHHVGRGLRSALGIHGFGKGGFLVEAGKSAHEVLSPLVARVEWPAEWRVVFAVPNHIEGRHGGEERSAFARLHSSVATSEALSRLVLLGMLPALIERDLEAFGEAVFDFNSRVGEMFASVQGGPYASAAVAGMVDLLRRAGARGVGQSSWGPGVFAIVGDEEQARHLALGTHDDWPAAVVWVARGVNQSATLECG